MTEEMKENKTGVRAFLEKKDVKISARRYGIDALGAMAQGLFASLLIGTIISTIGQQFGIMKMIHIRIQFFCGPIHSVRRHEHPLQPS